MASDPDQTEPRSEYFPDRALGGALYNSVTRSAIYCDQRIEVRLGQQLTGGADHPASAGKRGRLQFQAEQPVALEASGHPQRAGLHRAEAETAVIRRVADQKDSTVAGEPRPRDGPAHQRRADTAIAIVRMHRERAEQKRRAARTGGDMPEPHGADDTAALDRDQRQPVRGLTAFAEPLRGLSETACAIGLVQQGFARCNVRDFFFP